MIGGDLDRAVRELVDCDILRIQVTAREELAYDAFLAGRSLARVRGVARTNRGGIRWSLIEKVTDGPALASAYLYANGRREFLAYGSGLLRDLAPGVTAPLALGRHEAPDGGLTLWLEDVAGADVRRLDAMDLLPTARGLGRLAGRWLDRVPDAPWLFRGWIDRHAQPAAMQPGIDLLRTLRRPDVVEQRVGQPIEAAVALIESQPMFRAVLETLPVTLCHHDAVAANVLVRARAEGRETVLIDWESVGPGAIGADIASLLFSSVRRGDLDSSTVLRLVDGAIDAYTDGMREAGAAVDPALVRRGFDAAVGLRWTLVRDVASAIDRDTPIFRGSAPDEPPAAALRQLLDLTRLLFDSALRARSTDPTWPAAEGA
jgi:Phosphotransferase enzyme family